jgi:hypothetical protein
MVSIFFSLQYNYFIACLGNPALLSVVPTQQLTQDHGERVSRTCELCGEKLDNARAHMGLHILRKLRGVEEDLTKPVIPIF